MVYLLDTESRVLNGEDLTIDDGLKRKRIGFFYEYNKGYMKMKMRKEDEKEILIKC